VLLPVRDQIQRLHIDRNWVEQEPKETEQNAGGAAAGEFDDLDELEESENGSYLPNKKKAKGSMVGRPDPAEGRLVGRM